MELKDAISLIQHNDLAVTSIPQTWADLGCGSGLFSRALSSLLPQMSTIHAVDKSIQPSTVKQNEVTIQYQQLDFVRDQFPFHHLDGILMANSLHYVKDKPSFITKAKNALATQGVFLIVEYDLTTANTWVPYPIDFSSLQKLFIQSGFSSVHKLSERPSMYHTQNIYSALIRQ